MNKYSNGCTAHDMREVQLMNKIHGLEVRNARLREALEAMVEAYPMKDIGWLKACECSMCQSYKDGKAALEAGKVDGMREALEDVYDTLDQETTMLGEEETFYLLRRDTMPKVKAALEAGKVDGMRGGDMTTRCGDG